MLKFSPLCFAAVLLLQLPANAAETVSASVKTATAPAERVAVALPNALLDGYAGRFELMPGFVLELSRDGDRFFAQGTGQAKVPLMPVSNTAFYVKDNGAEIRFENGNDQLILEQGGHLVPGKRIK